jgi:hypothetical protein
MNRDDFTGLEFCFKNGQILLPNSKSLIKAKNESGNSGVFIELI